MSTPSDQLPVDANAGIDPTAAMGLPGEDMSWITDFHVNDEVLPLEAPLPEAASSGTEEKPEDKTAAPAVKVDGEAVVEIKADALADVAADLAAAPDKVAAADASPDEQLSPLEESYIKQLPESQQPAARSKFKGHSFWDFYLNSEKPKEDVRSHMEQRSPANYAEFETAVIAHYFAKPQEVLSDLYQRDSATFQKVATAVYNGDQRYFAKLLTGRDSFDPATLKTALDFYEANKDRISEDESLSAIDEETLTSMEQFFPEKVPILRAQLEAAHKLKAENETLKTAAKSDDKAVDPRAAEAEQQMQAAKVEAEIWDVARDTVGDFIEAKARASAGIAVTSEERQSAPMVALLKDLKAEVLFYGLNVDGKQLLPSFHEGFTDWGKEREPFKQSLVNMAKFAKAHEKNNVVDVAKGTLPLAETYYEDRLKNPIFKQIDDLLALVTSQGKAAPRMDPIIPGALPAGGGAKSGAGATGGDWLIDDALARSSK